MFLWTLSTYSGCMFTVLPELLRSVRRPRLYHLVQKACTVHAAVSGMKSLPVQVSYCPLFRDPMRVWSFSDFRSARG